MLLSFQVFHSDCLLLPTWMIHSLCLLLSCRITQSLCLLLSQVRVSFIFIVTIQVHKSIATTCYHLIMCFSHSYCYYPWTWINRQPCYYRFTCFTHSRCYYSCPMIHSSGNGTIALHGSFIRGVTIRQYDSLIDCCYYSFSWFISLICYYQIIWFNSRPCYYLLQCFIQILLLLSAIINQSYLLLQS